MSKIVFALLLSGGCLALVASCGTRRNPAFCCTSEAECAEVGLPYPSTCQPGLFCEATECVEPTCSRPSDCMEPGLPLCVDGVCRACDSSNNDGCSAELPVCEGATNQCTACGSNDDCASHDGTPICNEAGACVACEMSTDCANPTPVCDAGGCRACELDSDCDSMVCDDDGSCLDVNEAIFLSPTGLDSGMCNAQQPCKNLSYAVSVATPTRYHIVMAPGTYQHTLARIDQKTIHIHGYGATIQLSIPTAADPLSWIDVVNGGSLSVSGLTITQSTATNANAIRCTTNGTVILEDFRHATPYTAVSAVDCAIEISRSSFDVTDGTRLAIDVGGSFASTTFAMQTSVVRDSSIRVSAPLTVTNNLFTEGKADFAASRGLVSFNTFYNRAFTDFAVQCSTRDPERTLLSSNIIWTPVSTQARVGPCRAENNLIGPVCLQCDANNNFNEDPRFVDAVGGDFHLQGSSPAVDKAMTGPALDHEGDVRPSGSAFDLGFDEMQ